MKNGCAIKFETKEIRVTKKFLKAAEVFGSEEYETLLQLIKNLPSYTIRVNTVYRRYQHAE